MTHNCDISPADPTRAAALEAAQALRAALGDAFTMMDCRKALHVHPDPERAAQWLASGAWRSGKLISWNHDALERSQALLCAELSLPAHRVGSVLKDCAGSEVIARRKLLGEPLLQP